MNKKWEYRIESLKSEGFNSKESLMKIKDYLSKIGLEGWELIGLIPTFQTFTKSGLNAKHLSLSKCVLFLKREIS